MQAGTLHRASRPEYSAAYRADSERVRGKPLGGPRPIEARFSSSLERPFRLVLAGSAGGKVRSAARLVAEAAMLSGLWAAQRDDYPITVKTGHSLSELVLAPNEIDYTGITRPDALLAISAEGVAKAGRQLAAMTAEERVFALPALAELKTRARVTIVDPAACGARIGSGRIALYVAARAVRELGFLPLEALEAAASVNAEYAAENLETIRAAVSAL
jgi:Pyruvate/2-oxoacid:ferredoxin oxidoreductase gamma subunit